MLTEIITNKHKGCIERHKKYVSQAFDWLLVNLPELFEGYDSDYLGEIIASHDRSKYSEEEFEPYAGYFYTYTDDEGVGRAVREDYEKAILHHQNVEPHHWQYWVLIQNDGSLKPLEMPHINMLEMICDWWSYSFHVDDLYDMIYWYRCHKSYISLHEKTQQKVEEILNLIETKLKSMEEIKDE